MIRCLQPLLYGTRIVAVSPSEAITCVQEKNYRMAEFLLWEYFIPESWIFTCYVLLYDALLLLKVLTEAAMSVIVIKSVSSFMVFLKTQDRKKNSGVHNYAWISHVICYCIFAYKITQNQLCCMKATRKKLSEHDFKSLQSLWAFF